MRRSSFCLTVNRKQINVADIKLTIMYAILVTIGEINFNCQVFTPNRVVKVFEY